MKIQCRAKPIASLVYCAWGRGQGERWRRGVGLGMQPNCMHTHNPIQVSLGADIFLGFSELHHQLTAPLVHPWTPEHASLKVNPLQHYMQWGCRSTGQPLAAIPQDFSRKQKRPRERQKKTCLTLGVPHVALMQIPKGVQFWMICATEDDCWGWTRNRC